MEIEINITLRGVDIVVYGEYEMADKGDMETPPTSESLYIYKVTTVGCDTDISPLLNEDEVAELALSEFHRDNDDRILDNKLSELGL